MADEKSDEIRRLLDKGDAIGALCRAVELAGCTMTLYGQPIGEEGLRTAAACSGLARALGEELTPDEVKAIAAEADAQDDQEFTCTCGPNPPEVAECLACGMADCPEGEPLHYHHDGCPACDVEDDGYEARLRRLWNPKDTDNA